MIKTRSRFRTATLLTSLAASVTLAACGSSRAPGEMRLVTDDFIIRVSVDSLPVRAMETIRYRVVVSDKKTGKPIENGQGRVFATNSDRRTTYNGLEPSGELGTYKTTMYLVTSGLWAVAIQFRRDSTQALQKTEQWTQDVLPGDPIGTIETPGSARINRDSVVRADSIAKADSIKKAGGTTPPPPSKP